MRGHITKRGKNSYSIAVSLGKDANTGKYKYQWVTVKGNKKDAEKRLSELLNQLDNGTFIKPDKVTVAVYLEQWLRDYVEPNCSLKTSENYTQLINKHIIPEIGSIRLAELQSQHLQNLYTKKRDRGLSDRTVRYLYSLMCQVLGYGMKKGVLNRNVAWLTEPPRVEHKTVATLKADNLTCFLEAAKETPYYVLFYLLLHTGLRRGEALALKWKHIDMGLAALGVEAYLSVTQSLNKINGNIYLKEPKTSAGKRRVALPPSLTLVLQQYENEQKALYAKLGQSLSDDDYVFCHIDRSPFDPSTVSHAFANILKKAGLPPMPLHGLRHTHASLLLQAGVHPKVVGDRLGHSSIRVTLDTYSHVIGGLQEMAAQRFDDFISAKNRPISNLLAETEKAPVH